jgi:hypothetical protein
MPSNAALAVALKRQSAAPASMWANFFAKVRCELFFIKILSKTFMRNARLFV